MGSFKFDSVHEIEMSREIVEESMKLRSYKSRSHWRQEVEEKKKNSNSFWNGTCDL